MEERSILDKKLKSENLKSKENLEPRTWYPINRVVFYIASVHTLEKKM